MSVRPDELSGKKESSALKPRKSPLQSRARKTVERIMDAAASILDEQAVDRITTNQIAERANVNIASLYQYFPNKFAIVIALAERIREEHKIVLEEAITSRTGEFSWERDMVQYNLNALAAAVRIEGYIGTWLALRTTPELSKFYHDLGLDTAKWLLPHMEKAMPNYDSDVLKIITEMLVETGAMVLDRYAKDGKDKADTFAREIGRMQSLYLHSYIDAMPR